MKLANIDLGKLSVSSLNMRHEKKAPDVSDILPTIRARGVLVPLLVRPGDGDSFEIVAGRRRFFAASLVAEEQRAQGGEIEALPCAIMEAGDDAAAIEASLIENIARLDPDEVSQWETFTRMVKEGRGVEEIGTTFGLTELAVRRVLALGNLLPRIRALYRSEDIDARTVRHLTLASKAQQKDWLKLFDSEDGYAPTGSELKAWLLGGAEISTKAALFDLDGYKGRIITDLFGEHGFFADADLFWQTQNEAIAARIDAYKAAGWADVELLEKGTRFASWEYEKTPKPKGGKVFVTVFANGEVTFHEGYLSSKEAKKARAQEARANGDESRNGPACTLRPETTSTLQTYIDLHRHAACRTVLLDHPAAALRLMLAHAITGSPLWTVRIEEQTARHQTIAESLETSPAETLFDAKRREVLARLGFSPEAPTVTGGEAEGQDTAGVFARLLTLPDGEVLAILCVVMGETLMAASPLIELLGTYLKVDMNAFWAPDTVFFDLLRDRQVTNAMLRHVAGKKIADANLTEKVKTQKAIIRDCLDGTNNRKKVEGWLPKWLAFPPAAYTGRPSPTLERFKEIAGLAEGLPAAPVRWAPDPSESPTDITAVNTTQTATGHAPQEDDFAVAAE